MREVEGKKSKLLFIPIILFFCIMFFSTIFALVYATNSNILKNIKINNIEVSGLTKSEAENLLKEKIDSIMNDEITLKHGEYEKTVTLKQMELVTDMSDKVFKACTIGRDKNIIANNYKIIELLFGSGENLELEFEFNNEIVKSIYSNLDDEWTDNFIDNSYYIDDDKLVIVRGKAGVVIDEEALQAKVNEVIREKIEGKEVNIIDIPTISKEPEEINIEKIRNEIYKEPQNASYDKETSSLHTHVNGVDLKTSIEEAKEILKEEKEEYEIPLEITKPSITTEMLGEEAFPDKLSTFSTRFDAGNTNRAKNLELSVSEIDGTVLLPGETFSFNGVVGPRTKAKGYLLAGAYSAGELVESYGGGVCQVSSTLYNAVLYANLEIVERYNHSSIVSYVDPGRDATVSYGVKDFKFKNSRDYAVKIKAQAKSGMITMEFWGIKENNEVEIEITSEVTEKMPRSIKYEYDKKLKANEEVVETEGADGVKSIAYKTIRKNGEVLSKTVLSEDSYNPMKKVIRTGTKK